MTTKEKGDIGLTQVTARLTEIGWNVNLPIAEHLRYDLIAERNGVMKRVQVRYCCIHKGSLNVDLKGTWSNKKGNHIRNFKKGDYDALGIYCPDNREIYFVDAVELRSTQFSLRIEPLKGKRTDARVHWAKDYKDFQGRLPMSQLNANLAPSLRR